MIESLVSWLFLGPICAFCAVVIIRWMIGGDVEAWVGSLAILGIILTLAIAVGSHNTAVQICAVTGMVSLMVFFPFAGDYLDRQDLRTITAEHIDKGHAELSLHPENFPAWFTLARNLYEFGYRGHAIALAEQTLDRIPNVPDPFKNCSVRDLFRTEEYEVKKWRRESGHPSYHKPLLCPRCKAPNLPGHINCQRCGGPYLLELSRKAPRRSKVFAKLLLGWAVIAVLIPSAGVAAIMAKGALGSMSVLAVILAGGATLFFVLKPPRGVSSSSAPFS